MNDNNLEFYIKKYGGSYWSKNEYCRYYFNLSAIRKIFNLQDSLTEERKEYLIKEYFEPLDKNGHYEDKKIYFDVNSQKFRHKGCPNVCSVIENFILNEFEGLNNSDNYKDGVLKDLIDDEND